MVPSLYERAPFLHGEQAAGLCRTRQGSFCMLGPKTGWGWQRPDVGVQDQAPLYLDCAPAPAPAALRDGRQTALQEGRSLTRPFRLSSIRATFAAVLLCSRRPARLRAYECLPGRATVDLAWPPMPIWLPPLLLLAANGARLGSGAECCEMRNKVLFFRSTRAFCANG